MITVACVWVAANVPYGVEYVTRLQAMVARHLAIPYRFVCLTDRPWAVPAEVETIPIPAVGPLPGWWAKVSLFDRRLALGDRVLYLDLDVLVVGDLRPVAEYPEPFALCPPGGTFAGRDGLRVVRRYNSSVMVFDREPTYTILDHWSPSIAGRLWGDQDWIGEWVPDAAILPAAWVPRLSELSGAPGPDVRVVLCKKPKNHDAAARWPWVRAVWDPEGAQNLAERGTA